jgi:L-threonylcarbamoyladenylate synthase
MLAMSAALNSTELAHAVGILRRGGLVAFPTETVYGLGARALDPVALARIFSAKGRPVNHPLIAHVLGEREARELAAAWSPLASRLASAFWPGPLTLVVPRAPHVPLELTGGGDSVGLRAPRHPIARALLEALGEPIAAPSANRYQTVSPTTAAHVVASLGDRVDLILDGGPCTEGIESTVVDVRGEVPVILRPGALDWVTLQTVAPTLLDSAVETAPARSEDDPHLSPGLDRRHYAPRTPLVVLSGPSELLAEASLRGERGQTVALLLVSPLADGIPAGGARVHVLGPDPVAYARGLFAKLHELDAAGVDVVLVEGVPRSPRWGAVRDRLRRASAEG